MCEKVKIRNAIIVSAEILADNTYTGIALVFDYGGPTQQSGPHVFTERLMRNIMRAADTRSWSEVVGKAIRVRTGPNPSPLLPQGDVPLAIGHLLDNSLWYNL